MAKRLLVVMALVACAEPRAPTAPVAAPPAAAAPKPKGGRLVVRHFKTGLSGCGANGCAPVAGVPSPVAAIVQSGPGRYIASTATSSFEVAIASGIVEELPAAGPGVITRLEDDSLVRYEHFSTRSRVFR